MNIYYTDTVSISESGEFIESLSDIANDKTENVPAEIQKLLDPTNHTIESSHINCSSNGKQYVRSDNSSGPQICENNETNLLTTAFGSITTIKSCDKTKSINCRTILWYLSFFGFMVNYMYRININIAIVGMVAVSKTINHTAAQAACSADLPTSNITINISDTATINPIIIQVNSCLSYTISLVELSWPKKLNNRKFCLLIAAGSDR